MYLLASNNLRGQGSFEDKSVDFVTSYSMSGHVLLIFDHYSSVKGSKEC